MTWKKEQPNEPGWWWFRYSDQHCPKVLEVFIDEADGCWSVRTGDGLFDMNFLDNYDGQWGWPGPLAEPQEPIGRII